ncbi:MAG: nuclear transport factor 2 family protein [Mycobacteriales bacterium]
MTEMTHPEELVRRYVAVWSEPDPDARRESVAALWADGGVEFVEGAQFRGHAELSERVAHAYEAFVGSGRYAVTSGDDVTTHGDIVTFTVQLTAAGEVDWAARVFLVVGDDGRIREDYQLTVKPLPA